ncbi:hypothetical protein [Frankia sp. AgB32]|uniref:hypothetical protein n=1 Tax=Frankia sp. AgB32 TaxID=631119 RepID=UPI0020107432|nr:hypothetical protein [Frankia sp. AgB32]MCK9894628.1 hypothetical protein [Frankia sp. AgB32]
MTMMRNVLSGRRGAGVAAMGLLGLGLGLGLGLSGTAASAAPATDTAATTPAATAHRAAANHPRLAEARRLFGAGSGEAVHGEATIRTKDGFQVVDGQRGTVTAISPTSIAVRSADGYAATYVINGDTKVRADQKAAKVTDIHLGDTVQVGAKVAGGTRTAVFVVEPKK